MDKKATETCTAILQLPINIQLDCIKLVFFIYMNVKYFSSTNFSAFLTLDFSVFYCVNCGRERASPLLMESSAPAHGK